MLHETSFQIINMYSIGDKKPGFENVLVESVGLFFLQKKILSLPSTMIFIYLRWPFFFYET
jgi:hypothetical protein